MKKALIIVILSMVPAYIFSQTFITLNKALSECAAEIKEHFIKDSRALIFIENEAVTRELSSLLVSQRHLAIVERDEKVLKAIESEQNYQMTGNVSDATATSIGKQLGAQLIIIGSIESNGELFNINIRVVDIEKAQRVMDKWWNNVRIEPSKTARLHTVGASVGSTFYAPFLIGTVRGTFSPFDNFFIEAGMDVGFFHGSNNKEDSDYLNSYGLNIDSYFSLYPFIHLNFFLPFKNSGGLYIGAGAGYMYSKYEFNDGIAEANIFALDVIAGANLFDFLDVSYTMRTDFMNFFKGINHKVSVGYVYRFKQK
ncbi:MAG: CsgG/HfaB family protein [Treponema sp.]|nr:CsgG/HfaB family protein [Treponema sp.]